ncbi:DUF2474 domain-containing protein [Oceaniglobus trochenteri]|nr:DUF2474 domain-containing protein [Oceaniglobus trochenteri]
MGRRLMWFLFYWALGVGALTVVGLAIRAFIG